ncbi:GtrA family protein [Candidatus Woesearchaeota archaeon]|jgi:putative flippase GtrA|nr:GtrA family protein [Candidatus Woesearchaeota archaeon]MBT7555361.1 GtrA family protein [Candidatus Woesearchaeota archaeon]
MLIRQAKKFIAIGVVNTAVYYLLYSIFLNIGIDYQLSVLLATILGITFSFKTLSNFVFYGKNKSSIYKFIFTYLLIYFLNIMFIKYLNIVLLDYYISGLISAILCAFISFFINKNFVFNVNKKT